MDDICQNNHKGNAESIEAHKTSSAEQRKAMRERIYNFALRRGDRGLTADEVSLVSGFVHNRVAPRISELKKEGLLIPTTKTRKTRFGKSARVLIADVISKEQQNADIR